MESCGRGVRSSAMTQIAGVDIFNRPWLLSADQLSLLASGFMSPISLSGEQTGAASEEAPAPPGALQGAGRNPVGGRPYRAVGDVAVIPVLGILIHRGGPHGPFATYESLKFQINEAAKDTSVKSIILDIDSAGGEAIGAFETADVVRAAAQIKPVVAMATGLCCSAAYAIASAATKIVTSRSSVIGSIGVVLLHADYSHALHERGVVPTLIHAGKKKVDGTPYKPLTDEVKASLKAEVETFQSLLVSTVANNRPGLSRKAIRAMEADTYIGAAAVAIGLADAVGSFEGVLAVMAKGSSSRTGFAERKARTQSSSDLQLQLTAEEATTAAVDRVTAIMMSPHARGLETLAASLAKLSPSEISTDAAVEMLAIQHLRTDVQMSQRACNSQYGLVFHDDNGPRPSAWDAVLSKRGMKI